MTFTALWLNALSFGVSTDSEDNADALQLAVDTAYENRLRKVFLPVGAYKIRRAVDISGVTLESAGPVSGGCLIQTVEGQGCVTIQGHRNGVHVPGGRLANMGLFMDAGLVGGIAVHVGGSDKLPDRFELEGLRITTNGLPHGLWARCINIIGTGRLSPPGVRGCTIHDVEFFNCAGPGIVAWGVNGLVVSGLKGYTGGGSAANTGIWIGGTPQVQSTDVQIMASRCDGPLNVTNTIQSIFMGRFHGGLQQDALSQQSNRFLSV